MFPRRQLKFKFHVRVKANVETGKIKRKDYMQLHEGAELTFKFEIICVKSKASIIWLGYYTGN